MSATPSFLVVVPTIRQDRAGFDDVMARVKATFSLPTEFHVLDGSEGKPVALNRALGSLLPASSHAFYVTMDDDYVPSEGWQERAVQAFDDLPRVGVLSLWVGDDPHLQQVVGAERLDPWQAAGATRFRRVQRGHHIAGAMLIMRREVALAVGPQPVTGEKYQIWEDAWRGRRVQALGWELAFVDGPTPEFIHYDDPPEYDAWRLEQIARSRKEQDRWLKDSGIPDPWTLRLRRWLARLRGKA